MNHLTFRASFHRSNNPQTWSVIAVVVASARDGGGAAADGQGRTMCCGPALAAARTSAAVARRDAADIIMVLNWYIWVWKIANDVVQTQLEYYFMVPIECWRRATDEFTWSGMMHDAWSHIGTDVWYHNIMVLISNILRDLAFREFCTGTKYKIWFYLRGAETWGFHESPSFPKSKR